MANRNLSADQVRAALDAAASVHHDYEQVTLNGEHDRQWPAFYAAYVLRRLNDFMSNCIRLRGPDDWFCKARERE